MSKEIIVLIISWIISIVLLVGKVPKNKKRDAQIVFSFAQSVGWLYVFIQSYFNNLVFPFREFPKATDMLFSLHFIIYPTFVVFFILCYPKSSGKWKIFFYYLVWISINQIYESLLEHYTDLIDARNWKWYWGFLTKFFIYYIIYLFYKWFRKGLRNHTNSSTLRRD